ncbi:increased DNA methylation 2-like [Ipomoea triloba]|uniref:increased DNA methylation 2-like n=1 Tax=Ipomoea triloba TaxID=35885 RepID=UPI00125E7E25|nr:increased DNA methylation 2-like [Ipomoea triloba]
MENAGGAASSSGKTVVVATDDQMFVLHMIMGIYLGPHLKDENKSALRRIAEGIQHYSPHQLAGTCFRTADIERLYYYVLRNTQNQSVILPLPLFYQSFNAENLFPPHLHPLRLHNNGYHVVENIAFINDPNVEDFITPSFLEKFKRLTGIKRLVLDNNGYWASPIPIGEDNDDEELEKKAMIVLPTPPSKEEWRDIVSSTKGGYSISGSAANGQMGPVLGLVDIGESEDSYLFHVSLPGVKRDESEFECAVEDDGTVTINGVTTHGEKIVHKTIENQHHIFEMQSQNICPPGHFSISFKLPGPVNSEKFQGKLGTDAILEGLVGKAEQKGH